MSQYKQEFDNLAQLSAEATLTLAELSKGLKKRQLERVMMAIMEYPMPNSRTLMSKEEETAVRVGVNLKEMQMKLAVLNMAMSEEEANKEVGDEQADQEN